MSEKSSWTVATNNDCFEIKNHDGVLVGKFKNIEAVLSHFVLALQQNHQLKLLLEAIQLTEREQEVLQDLSLKMDITPNRVIVQALRLYQSHYDPSPPLDKLESTEQLMKPFKYADRTIPEGYVCNDCGAMNVRLYRRYQTMLDKQKLLCRKCAILNQGQNPDHPSEHTIGWLVAAVPTEDGETFWGYTSVPQAGVNWWNSLRTGEEENSASYFRESLIRLKRAQVKWVASYTDEDAPEWPMSLKHNLWVQDLQRIADAYMDEHEVDDHELVTEDWFQSIGATWTPSESNDYATSLKLGPLEYYHFPTYDSVVLSAYDKCELKTRGEVRSLIRLFKIK